MKDGTFVVPLLLLASLAVASLGLQAVQLPAKDDSEAEHQEEFDQIDHRLDHLTAKIVELENRIERRLDPARILKARSLKAKVIKLEAPSCSGKHDFQCGGTDPQCVGVLVVCDGIKDCRNGADEDPRRCKLQLKAGDVFDGKFIFNDCTKRDPDDIEVEITSVRASTAYNSFLKVTANVELWHEDDKVDGRTSFPTTGYFSFGTSKIVLRPPSDERIYHVLEFDGWDFNRAVGYLKRDSGAVCAKVIYVRKQ